MSNADCSKYLEFFGKLTDNELRFVASKADTRPVIKGEPIFAEGEQADKVFIVRDGSIKVYKMSEDGKELILGLWVGDQVIGEDSVFNGEVYSVSAVALKDCCLTIFTRDAIKSIILQMPTIGLRMIEGLSRKLALSTEQVGELAFRDAKGRLASALMRLADEHGRIDREGVVIDIVLTHEVLAHFTNLSRTTITELLLELRESNLIKIRHRRIMLVDQYGIEQWASARSAAVD